VCLSRGCADILVLTPNAQRLTPSWSSQQDLSGLDCLHLAQWAAAHADEVAAPLLSVAERRRLRAYGYWRARRSWRRTPIP
jgi:hypothetical protein